ncbi:unnamed protein product [Brassica rapa]|uniref:Uncharacterized protein n=2 Tax=Brassica TaxID=3705 RepID=A0A8D9M561_BRACM|nr:unnamed protein product [Brassica napus]CAG7897445.1 unnamed protein product [Brassica rapa]
MQYTTRKHMFKDDICRNSIFDVILSGHSDQSDSDQVCNLWSHIMKPRSKRRRVGRFEKFRVELHCHFTLRRLRENFYTISIEELVNMFSCSSRFNRIVEISSLLAPPKGFRWRLQHWEGEDEASVSVSVSEADESWTQSKPGE